MHNELQRPVRFGAGGQMMVEDTRDIDLEGESVGAAIPVVLTTDGLAPTANNQVALADNSAMAIHAFVACINPATGDASTWLILAGAKRGAGAGTAAMIAGAAPAVIAQDVGLAATVVAITADAVNGCIAITCTGIVGATLTWAASITTSEAVA